MLPFDVTTRMSDQVGLASRPQLIRELGYSGKTVDGWVRHGHLEVVRINHRPLVGTYRVPGSAVPPEQLGMAAVLRCRPVAWLSGPAVLGLLGFEGYSPADGFVVQVPAGRVVRNVPFPVRIDPAYDRPPARRGPLPIALPVEAVAVTALFVTGKQLRTTVDTAVYKGLVDMPALREKARRVGARELVGMIDDGVFDQESEGERAMKPVLQVLTPPPRWQQWVAPDTRVDCLLEDVPVVIEYLGDEAHGMAHQREHDHARTRRIEALGYVVIEVTAADLRKPDELIAGILGVRAGLLSARAHALR